MTNKELREKIDRLEAELAEVKEKVDALPKSVGGGVFKPEDGQEYWFISARGDVYYDKWDNHRIDQRMYAISNCFPTKQSAEDRVRVLKLIQKARESQDGFVPDWENTGQDKHQLYFRSSVKEICIMSSQLLNLDSTFGFWEDESVCEQFIDENREELLWYFMEYLR